MEDEGEWGGGEECLLRTPSRDREQFHRFASKSPVSVMGPYLIDSSFVRRERQTQEVQGHGSPWESGFHGDASVWS